MDLDLSTVLLFITGVLTGVVTALRIVAPRTETKKDNKILEYGEKALEILPDPKAK